MNKFVHFLCIAHNNTKKKPEINFDTQKRFMRISEKVGFRPKLPTHTLKLITFGNSELPDKCD